MKKITSTGRKRNKKTKRHMKQLLITLLLSAFAGGLSAQVTVGSIAPPYKGNLLQIHSSGGLGLPRVSLESLTTLAPFITGTPSADDAKAHVGLLVYNLATTNGFKQGVYVWDGVKWEEAGAGADSEESADKRWFYMPAFNLNMDAIGAKTVDLYEVYKQFQSPLIKSDVSTTISPFYAKGELDYAVIYYDTAVVTVQSINTYGVMSYTVKDTDPGPTSFMNVVFIVKQ